MYVAKDDTLRKAPEHCVSSKDKEESLQLRKAGNELFSKQKYSEALKFYEKSLSLNPKDAQTWANIALCHLKKECFNLKEAYKNAHEAVRLDPTNPKRE